LNAAIRAFSEVGYAGATTVEIARAAGVTQPLVHHHFGSKERLWRAAMDVLFADVPRLITPGMDTSRSETILASVERFIRFVAAHPEVTRVVAREGAAPSPRLDYLLKRYLHAPFRELVDNLHAAQRAGVVAAEVRPELLLFLVLGAGSHLFDVSALARQSFGIDTSAAWTSDAFIMLMRTLLEQGVVRRGT
jgi:AcrR family transcriptional regulator